jgi:hypothetical protein
MKIDLLPRGPSGISANKWYKWYNKSLVVNKCLLQGIDSYMTSLPAGPISLNNMW